jgi:hypothetical protein
MKGLLASPFQQVAPMSLPLLPFEHSLPQIHRALLLAAHDLPQL